VESDDVSPGERSQPEKRRYAAALRLKLRIKGALTRFPGLYARILPVYRTWRWRLMERRLARQASRGEYDPFLDPHGILQVPPRSIRFSVGREFAPEKGLGRVVGGDWDLRREEFVKLDVYEAFRDVVAGRASWPETEFYRRVMACIMDGEVLWSCSNEQEFQQRCSSLEALYADIAENGYKSVAERGTNPHEPLSLFGLDEIGVAIARDGELLFTNGAHRLTIAYLLDLPVIPVQVLARHPGWMAFRRDVADYAVRHGGRLRQLVGHPDLANIPARGDCPALLSLIERHLRARDGVVIDVGAGWGFFSFALERRGFACIAVEEHGEDLRFLERLKEIYRSGISIHTGQCCTLQAGEDGFRVLLALAGLRGVAGAEPERLSQWLEGLTVNEAFLADDEDMVKFVMDRTHLRQAEEIPIAGRESLFHLWND
jgi:hypothetical protein